MIPQLAIHYYYYYYRFTALCPGYPDEPAP